MPHFGHHHHHDHHHHCHGHDCHCHHSAATIGIYPSLFGTKPKLAPPTNIPPPPNINYQAPLMNTSMPPQPIMNYQTPYAPSQNFVQPMAPSMLNPIQAPQPTPYSTVNNFQYQPNATNNNNMSAFPGERYRNPFI